jgi:TonB family protein
LAHPGGALADTRIWTVQNDRIGGCKMWAQFEGSGDPHLILTKATNGSLIVIATNTGWSAKKSLYQLVLTIDGRSWKAWAFGSDDPVPQFMIKVDEAFREAFAAGSSLTFTSDKGDLIDRFSLKGSSAALKLLDDCVVKTKREEEIAKAQAGRLSAIPADPFGKLNGPSRAIPIANDRYWVTPDDYPARALRDNQQGTVRVKLEISATGAVSNCSVTQSSGYSALDEATCSLITRRARFTPALDNQGNPTTDSSEKQYNWSLPVSVPSSAATSATPTNGNGRPAS